MLVNRTPLAFSLANLPEPGTIHHDPERHLEKDVESQSEDEPAAAFTWLQESEPRNRTGKGKKKQNRALHAFAKAAKSSGDQALYVVLSMH
jgi:hypothetical protein